LLTYAFCTYNRASRLERLVTAMRAQACRESFEILAINNNSSDNTERILSDLASQPGPRLRWVTERVQGIVAARNRALAEAMASDILVFIDDDELPRPGVLAAAAHAIREEGAQCAGGKVVVDFTGLDRPRWLEDDVLGFLAQVDHSPEPFWIRDDSTPVWTANVAYDMALFRAQPQLQFDRRYDRIGKGTGGGEDLMMFRALLAAGTRIRYRPDMVVLHSVEPWRLRRRYFLEAHYRSGYRRGEHDLPDYPRTVLRMPPFLVAQLASHLARTASKGLMRQPGLLRQAMNVAYAWGALRGYRHRARTETANSSRTT
jgi:glycosyltransferase involved in cell wall biosynthesis